MEKNSEKDFQAAKKLFNSGYYSHFLFFCHLSIEKLLKALVTQKIKEHPPFTHDLNKLADIAGLNLNLEQEKILKVISTFNIAGRYADVKFEFYQKYNKKEYTQRYFKITKDLLLWLKKEFPKK